MVFKSKGGSAGQASGGSAGMSFIGQEVEMTGNMTSQGDIHIDGKIDGDVTCKGLIIGETGAIKGNVRAEHARIAGAISGTIDIRTLTIDRTGRIEGDLRYETVSIESGAKVEGRVSIAAGQDAGLKLVASDA